MVASAPPVPSWRVVRHRKMLSAAIAVLRDRPAEEISMDEIARAAGVGKATLYRYFDTKEVLLRACLEEVVNELGAKIERAEAMALPPPERLRAIIGTMVETFSRHLLPLRLLMQRQGELHEAWRRSVQGSRRRLVAVLHRHFADGAATGYYRSMDTGLVPNLIMGMVRGGVAHTPGASNQELTDRICDFVLHGCGRAENRLERRAG